MSNEDFDKLLSSYLEHHGESPTITTYSGNISQVSGNENAKAQFHILGTISNYHWHGYPSMYDPSTIVGQTKIRYMQHMITSPDKRFIPSSPRNQILHFIKSAESEQLIQAILFLIRLDKQDEKSNQDTECPEPSPKKRRRTVITKRIDRQGIKEKYLSPGLEELISLSKTDRTVYSTFKNELMNSGTIKWRYSEEGRNVCVMNDINVMTGHMIPNSFVHVSCEDYENGPIIKCTCHIYKFLQHADHQQEIRYELDPETSCMHCRFFFDHLLNAYEEVCTGRQLTRPLEMVKVFIDKMNDPILLLGEAIKSGTTKFSVQGNDYFSLVTLNFTGGKCYMKCHGGVCAASNVNKKRMPRVFSLANKEKMCSHLQTCHEHSTTITQLFPDYFKEGIEEENEEFETEELINNEDDEMIGRDLHSNFDTATGLWDYKSLSSNRKPKKMMDKDLIRNTAERIKMIVDYAELNPTFNFKPPISLNGDPNKCINCNCGVELNKDDYFFEGMGRVYTRVGAVKFNYYSIICPKKKCILRYSDFADQYSLFFYTMQTCAGDEIGWDFVSAVKTSKISFTGYCKQMTRYYETTKEDSEPFMSPTTFISWFFSWLSAFKIDFRKEIDPYCRYTPKILACDGTHIGVLLRHLQMDKPVTKNDTNEVIPWVHGRIARLLFQDESARRHVKYMCLKYINAINTDELLSEVDETRLTLAALETVDKPVRIFLLPFLQPGLEQQHRRVQAELLHQLSGTGAITSVLPHRAVNLLSTICNKIELNEGCSPELGKMRQFNTQIVDLIWVGLKENCTTYMIPFFRYLIQKLESIHRNDPIPTPVNELENSYDPRSGAAYYFSRSGNQVRQMPQYQKTLDDKKKKKVIEPQDAPCTKKYPKISHGGYSYIMLWFCPIHGHSYGFHLIDGAEGPKDVFSSLLKFKEEMPEEVFYDNACHLHEYCLNREPDLFKNTRFWYDLFHSIVHLCGINFKSTRVQGLDGINTEICEQVNSYLQSIKYTGAHLSQEHFVFFLQFFLYLLNKDKTERQKKMAKIALAGMD